MKFLAVLGLLAVTASSRILTFINLADDKGGYGTGKSTDTRKVDDHSNQHGSDNSGKNDGKSDGSSGKYGESSGSRDDKSSSQGYGSSDGKKGQGIDNSKGREDDKKNSKDCSKRCSSSTDAPDVKKYDDKSGRGNGPQIASPSVFSKPSKFFGQYSLSLPQSDLEVNASHFIFKDCNTHQVPFQVKNSNCAFGRPESTKFTCDYDRASVYVGLLPRVAKHSKRGDDHDFFDDQDNLLFSARFQRPAGKSITSHGDFNDGFYTAELPKYNVKVSGNQIWAQGCEGEPIDFEHGESDDIDFKNYFKGYESKKKGSNGCSVRQQEVFGEAFKSSQKIKVRENNGFDFQDSKGHSVAYCQPHSW